MQSGSESSSAVLSDSSLTLSPFSDSSLRSEPTSDETPDLGAFTTVFHTLSHYQPVPRPRLQVAPSATTAISSTRSDDLGGAPRPAAESSAFEANSASLSSSVLTTSSISSSPYPPSTARPGQYTFPLHDSVNIHDSNDSYNTSSPSSSTPAILDDATSEDEVQLVPLDSDDSVFDLDSDVSSYNDPPPPEPSLGHLNEALSFLAAERAKWSADRSRLRLSSKDSGKRKRRRKRPPPKGSASNRSARGGAVTDVDTIADEEDSAAAPAARSSSASPHQGHHPASSFDTALPQRPTISPLKAPTSHLSRRERRRLKQIASGVSLPVTAADVGTDVADAGSSSVAKGKVRNRLHQSKSTPQLRLKPSQLPEDSQDRELSPDEDQVAKHPDPGIEKMRKLARKLKVIFPQDQEKLDELLSGKCGRERGLALPLLNTAIRDGEQSLVVNDLDLEEDETQDAQRDFIDVRGPSPQPPPQPSPVRRSSGRGKAKAKDKTLPSQEDQKLPERLIHVFIDHSNILIGLLSWLKRHPKKFANLPLPPLPSNHQHHRSQSSSTHHPYYHHHFLQHHHSTPNYHSIDNGQVSSIPSSSSTSAGSTTFTTPGSATFVQQHSPHDRPLKPTNHLSHSALTMVLERGRPITRRVMVTSSPLYQPMHTAERLGYEVRIFMRVPDLGDGMDRERTTALVAGNGKHGRSISLGAAGVPALPTLATSLGKEEGISREKNVKGDFPAALKNPGWAPSTGTSQQGLSKKQRRRKNSASVDSGDSVPAQPPSTPPHQTPTADNSLVSPGNPMTPPKVKYREQGVDELLQLKLHQAIASADEMPYPLPSGSTIVLATGDGNVGQFNEDGFLGGVRTALRKGWDVELYAWEVGLSRRWAKEFGVGVGGKKGGGEYDGKFRVIGLEQFGEELVERSWW